MILKYFPDPETLSSEELRHLYRLKRFEEWLTFLTIVDRCRGKTSKVIEDESLLGPERVVFRHIGARAFTTELQEFMEGAEEQLKLLTETKN
jgi:hypothetical protein